MEIDWAALRAAATEVMGRAYAPYSNFPVGAAALVDDGRVVVGCNVESAGYGVTLCAECGVLSALHAGGGGRLAALSCVDAAGEPLMPCGRCRQLLWEHGGPQCLIDAVPRPLSMAELLPYAFDVTSLDAVRGPSGAVGGAGAHAPVVPPQLAEWRGRGTVFVHPDMLGGQQIWTGYWERSSGAMGVGSPEEGAPEEGAPEEGAPGEGAPGEGAPGEVAPGEGEPVGILEEGPNWPTAAEGVAWGRARTPRVVVVDADGAIFWAGTGEPPAEVGRAWQ